MAGHIGDIQVENLLEGQVRTSSRVYIELFEFNNIHGHPEYSTVHYRKLVQKASFLVMWLTYSLRLASSRCTIRKGSIRNSKR